MNVGDYVRTKIGISKCIRVIPIRENSFMYEFDKEVYEEVNYLTASELKKYKSSPNIIDLIEVGDYVNGNRVDFTNNNNKLSYENKCIGFYDGDGDITLFEKDIKTIVTREMFESMEYKVGD